MTTMTSAGPEGPTEGAGTTLRMRKGGARKHQQRPSLRYSVVFAPDATSENLRMTYQKHLEAVVDDEDTNKDTKYDAVEKDPSTNESSSSSLLDFLKEVIIRSPLKLATLLLIQVLNYCVLIPIVYAWKAVASIIGVLFYPPGETPNGSILFISLMSACIFRPLAFLLGLCEGILNTIFGLSLDGPMFRSFIGMVLNGYGFAFHTLHDSLTTPPGQWKISLDRFSTYLEENGLDLEMKLALNHRFVNNMLIYDDVQKALGLGVEDRIQQGRIDTDASTTTTVPSIHEASHYMHFATAVYRTAVMVGTVLQQSVITDSNNNSKDTNPTVSTKKSTDDFLDRMAPAGQNNFEDYNMLQYVGCKKEDVVFSHLSHGGSLDVLRHSAIVDHSTKSLVFTIRGTFSVSGVIIDWVSFSAPFCGGVGHVAMSEVATKMWDQTKDQILAKLEELPDDYSLVITGHSLGAGVACLLTILLYHEKCIKRHKIRCFAFAPPPTFFPLSAAPEAVAATTAYVHGDDMVPFLSVYHLRRFFKSMAALKKATKFMSTMEFIKIDWGFQDPSDEIVEAVRRAEEEGLRKVKGSDLLAIPAKAVIWLQPSTTTTTTSKDENTTSGASSSSSLFDAHVCDPEKLAQMPIRVPSTQTDVLAHHLASRYEIALQNVNARRPDNGKDNSQ